MRAKASKAPKLSKSDGFVDWTKTASEVVARIHGLTPWPGVRVLLHHQRDGSKQELLLRRARVVDNTEREGGGCKTFGDFHRQTTGPNSGWRLRRFGQGSGGIIGSTETRDGFCR
ncbi:MAG: hypothetical protein HC898_05210 [Phycisphaerales bacterium]|nr:hypothetical protein [Phycisphaerales bacterium]